ncbi:MAG TPA: hypothetical protein VMF90_14815 [Rhizobiaceae bacterium]|nr:hypothetical protein [Rhizobiaceae bacterium]
MPSNFSAFERDIKIATAGLEPPAVNAKLARFARQELHRVISSGQASTTYDRFVNGVKGVAEEAVRAPGPILYEFVNWPLVLRTVIGELQRRAPKRSGRYAAGFVALANGDLARDWSQIPPAAEVVIINVRPYTRKIESGGNRTGARHFEATTGSVARRFRGAFTFKIRFLNVGPGVHPEVPYRLRTNRGGRRGRRQGDRLTYPAIIINKAN